MAAAHRRYARRHERLVRARTVGRPSAVGRPGAVDLADAVDRAAVSPAVPLLLAGWPHPSFGSLVSELPRQPLRSHVPRESPSTDPCLGTSFPYGGQRPSARRKPEPLT